MQATITNAEDLSEIDLNTLKGITVLVTVPAAFSPTCTDACVPGILSHEPQILDAGADRIIVVSTDTPFSLSAWRKQYWPKSNIIFASDYGAYDVRSIIGSIKDESPDAPQVMAGLLRRSYSVIKDGEITWQFTEPDTKEYTLKMDRLIRAISDGK